eukprot:scaffold421215_cov61-Attheya_sp.AAC.2
MALAIELGHTGGIRLGLSLPGAILIILRAKRWSLEIASMETAGWKPSKSTPIPLSTRMENLCS